MRTSAAAPRVQKGGPQPYDLDVCSVTVLSVRGMACWLLPPIMALAILGCGRIPGAPSTTATRPGRPPDPGAPDAPPSIQALPELSLGSPGYTERGRQGLIIARDVFKASMPKPPPDRSFVALRQWIDTAVVEWIEQRSLGVEATKCQFNEPREATAAEQIVVHAVLGLLQEDTALSLQTIPAPQELDSEPEIAQIFQEVLLAQAAPFYSAAMVEFLECANTAVEGPPDMRHWARFCAARFNRLSATHAAKR